MNVLSLFDGMSCGQIALERSGIKVDNYFASEIDKYAIKVTQANFPNTKQLGDIKFLTKESFGSNNIDLLIGGSPCQGFSFAGKQLNFKDERSKLFFDYVSLLRQLNPKYFLMENVKMKKEYQDIISSYLGCEPITINSSLVSAQNRVRLYWTNIPGIEQPKNKKIYLAEVIEKGICDRKKSYCIDANYYKGGNLKQYFEKSRRQLVFCGAMRGRYIIDGKRKDGKMKTAGLTTQRMEIRCDGKTNTLTTVQKDNNAVFVNKFRKLTPIECERLQTVPDDYTNHVSNTQRYKMLGNGWTVDVISHIFNNIK